MPSLEIEKRVKNYLRDSQALKDYWQRPITAQQLQAEMERMAQHTKQPEMLRELFAALGNDPFVIAECLVRPILSERLKLGIVEWRKARLDSQNAGAEKQMPKVTAAANARYRLPPVLDGPSGCTDNTWSVTSTTGAPDVRWYHTAVWTGSEMIVWGGYDRSSSSFFVNTGGRYCALSPNPNAVKNFALFTLRNFTLTLLVIGLVALGIALIATSRGRRSHP